MAVSGLNSGVQAIAVGTNYTCALSTAGAVVCWGNNSLGQLGDGTTTQRLTPVVVSGLGSGVQAIAAGNAHTCALTTAGGVKCWGNSYYGQLGDGTMTTRLTPVTVSGLSSGVQAIAAGLSHTCALTTAGGVKCWGTNASQQLGDGTTTQRLTPVVVSGLGSGVQAIAAGELHSCALTTAGGVKCWGNNFYGQLGDGTTDVRYTPVDVLMDSDGDGVIDVSDAFPFNPAESVDTDHDGIGNNADTDDDGDGVPDYIDADPLNASVNTERLLPLNSGFKGSSVQESVAPL